MKKRILSILLLCCMVLTLLPTAAFAAGELPDVKLSVPTTFDKTVDLTKQNGELKIKDSKTYLIKGSTDPNWYFQYRIKIDGKNNTPHIFLDGVRLQAPEDGPAIELYGGASACLYFIGNDSELIGAENFAALQKNKTDGYLRVLVQTGTKLTCEGGRYGAGIGGSKVGIKKFSQGHGMNLHFGSLATDIYGGEILATSGVYGAGIGGGQGGVGEWIYVYSGKLTVRSVSEGAGIGGGQGGPGRFIYIKGGTVNAGSESGGAGIGSGDQDGQNKSEDAHHIEISGGTVEAWSNYAGAGIGGGRNGSGRDISITGGNLEDFLGVRKFLPEANVTTDQVGLVTGLAWTAVGGTTLEVEVNVVDGTGKLELTGNLGDVMKESAFAAMSFIRSRAKALGLAPDFYKTKDIHVHFPEGAVPKDGPSAGITICTAIVSALTNRPVRRDVAMTGEISIRGRVLAIGGLKEKTMAALRHGVKTVIIPAENEKDLEEIDQTVRQALQFITVSSADRVLEAALLPADDAAGTISVPAASAMPIPAPKTRRKPGIRQ